MQKSVPLFFCYLCKNIYKMINEVRNIVLAVINKNNYGYISPGDFNLYAQQAQLDIFEDYFYFYNSQITKENLRSSGSGYADIKKGYEEVIDSFSRIKELTNSGNNIYSLPDDYYLINTLIYNKTTEIERVSQAKITMLNMSNLTAPSTIFPAYVLGGATDSEIGNTVTVYPATITGASSVEANYVRYPKDPKWTFIKLEGGEPIFEPNQGDFQDFELPKSDMINLAYKILQYAGVSIRENEVYTYAQNEQVEQNNEEIR